MVLRLNYFDQNDFIHKDLTLFIFLSQEIEIGGILFLSALSVI